MIINNNTAARLKMTPRVTDAVSSAHGSRDRHSFLLGHTYNACCFFFICLFLYLSIYSYVRTIIYTYSYTARGKLKLIRNLVNGNDNCFDKIRVMRAQRFRSGAENSSAVFIGDFYLHTLFAGRTITTKPSSWFLSPLQFTEVGKNRLNQDLDPLYFISDF